MNELQECQLGILKKVIKIIEENNLNYYVVCGTALGAIKYQGFIPWDDDVDIALPRPDYEIFIEKMRDYQDKEIELQNYRYDKNVPFFFSKVRNVNTTYIENTVADFDMNHGVFIDIFPLDGYPKGKIQARIFEIQKILIWRTLSFVYKRNSFWKNLLTFPIRGVIKQNLNQIVKCYEKLISKYDIRTSDLLCNFGNSPSKNEYSPKHHYGKGIKIRFENIEVNVPEKYDNYLTKKYGEWRKELPLDEQIGHHYYVVCDLKCSYQNYIQKSMNGKVIIKK